MTWYFAIIMLSKFLVKLGKMICVIFCFTHCVATKAFLRNFCYYPCQFISSATECRMCGNGCGKCGCSKAWRRLGYLTTSWLASRLVDGSSIVHDTGRSARRTAWRRLAVKSNVSSLEQFSALVCARLGVRAEWISYPLSCHPKATLSHSF